MQVAKEDHLLGFKASQRDRDLMQVVTGQGSQRTISTAKYDTTRRGGKGREIMKRGPIVSIVPEELAGPELSDSQP